MIKNVARWFFGVDSVFLGGYLLYTRSTAAVAAFILASILIPPIERGVTTHLEFPLPAWSKVVLGLFMVCVILVSLPA